MGSVDEAVRLFHYITNKDKRSIFAGAELAVRSSGQQATFNVSQPIHRDAST
jgi:hypothetical protein